MNTGDWFKEMKEAVGRRTKKSIGGLGPAQ